MYIWEIGGINALNEVAFIFTDNGQPAYLSVYSCCYFIFALKVYPICLYNHDCDTNDIIFVHLDMLGGCAGCYLNSCIVTHEGTLDIHVSL